MRLGRPARSRRRVALAAAAVVGAVSVLLGVGLAGSGPQDAFAGWTAQPTQPMSGQLQAAETACEQSRPELVSSSPAVADMRGPTSMLVYLEGDRTTVCATGESAFGTLVTLSAGGSLSPAPGPGAITPHQLQVRVAADGQAFAALDGQAGAGVSAVTFVLDDGTSVQATVANNWFVAWWPENHGVQAAQITTASGTSTRTLNGYSGAAPAVNGQNGPAS